MVSDLISRMDFLLKHIDIILNDMEGKDFETFSKSDLLARATCFSLSQIGEQMNKLEEFLREQYPNLPWKEARKMRIIIVHVYNKIDYEQVYSTVVNDLPPLKESFEKVKETLLKHIDI